MSSGTEAADQVVSMSLRGIEVMAKISGEGAKHLAVYLFAALQGQKRTRGRVRLESMLRSGKELKVFAVRNEDLPTFCKEAKRYGVLYCALRDKKNVDGLCDVMARAEDASKINRIVERFKLATVDTASIKQEIVKSRSERHSDESRGAAQEMEQVLPAPEDGTSEPRATNEGAVSEDFLDNLLGKPEPAAEAQPVNEQQGTDHPAAEEWEVGTEPDRPRPLPQTQEERTTEPSSPSAPTSERNAAYEKVTIDPEKPNEKVSIRQLLREIREENRAAEARRRQPEQEPSLPKRKNRSRAASGSKVSVPTTGSRKRGKSK
ncbi:PcfB family protein [Paenibacillus agaridevorans]|uniref:PcfB family protein n=1 Tax=Paenibacillus agaridevorans TaxID=171404 RepID=UPI001BE43AEC|nr:PcfB family protein [Paenibacillus agaridevorans]